MGSQTVAPLWYHTVGAVKKRRWLPALLPRWTAILWLMRGHNLLTSFSFEKTSSQNSLKDFCLCRSTVLWRSWKVLSEYVLPEQKFQQPALCRVQASFVCIEACTFYWKYQMTMQKQYVCTTTVIFRKCKKEPQWDLNKANKLHWFSIAMQISWQVFYRLLLLDHGHKVKENYRALSKPDHALH